LATVGSLCTNHTEICKKTPNVRYCKFLLFLFLSPLPNPTFLCSCSLPSSLLYFRVCFFRPSSPVMSPLFSNCPFLPLPSPFFLFLLPCPSILHLPCPHYFHPTPSHSYHPSSLPFFSSSSTRPFSPLLSMQVVGWILFCSQSAMLKCFSII